MINNESLNHITYLAHQLKDVSNDMRLHVVWNDGKKDKVLKLENDELVPANDPEILPYMDKKMRGL